MIFPFAPHDLFVISAAVLVAALVLWWVLRPKRIYFIRHGRTLLNEREIKQGADGGLSEAGKAQAEQVGAALVPCGISLIVSSPYERAKETADIVKKHLKKRIRVTELLAERRNASVVVGKPTDDPEVKRIMGLTAYGYHDDDYRFADEENFTDLKTRARKCLSYLEGLPSHTVCAVTHHAFLHMLLSYMTLGEELHADGYVKLSFFNPAENGGITVCEYSPLARFSKTRGWSILTYNAIAQQSPAA